MVPMRELCPGMRVKIVDRWGPRCGQNYMGRMDKYLGQIVTIHEVYPSNAFIEEDAGTGPAGGHWYWNENCFDYIVEEEQKRFEAMSDSEILSLIFGN